MANDQVQGPIQLAGRGLVRRSSDHYEPGEYSAFDNVVVTPQDTIKKRPPVHGIGGVVSTRIKTRFLGHRDDVVIVAQHASTSATDLNNPTCAYLDENSFNNITLSKFGGGTFESALQAVSAFPGSRSYGIEGFIRNYQGDHLIVWHGDNSTNESNFYVVRSATLVVNDKPSDFAASTVSNIIANTLSYSPDFELPSRAVSAFLSHKDRLFIAINDTVYFSKTAEFTKFAVVDDGGFIRFPARGDITSIVALNDSIYVIFDNSVSVITYSAGPNIDLQTRTISDVIGGEDATVFQGEVYLVKNSALYSISNSNIDKVLDLDLGTIQPSHKLDKTVRGQSYRYELQLVAYDFSLYILSRRVQYVNSTSHPNIVIYNPSLTLDVPAFYSVDVESGSVSSVSFKTTVDYPVVAMYFMPIEDKHNKAKLVMLSGIFTQNTYFFYFGSHTMFMLATDNVVNLRSHAMDVFANSAGTGFIGATVRINIVIPNYSPDTMRYFIKKFRIMELQADLPLWDDPSLAPFPSTEAELELIVESGINTEGPSVARIMNQDLTGGNVSPAEVPYSTVKTFKFGVNQRAKSINIIIRTRTAVAGNANITVFGTDAGSLNSIASTTMEIVDLRTLWTYTKRSTPTNSRDYS